MFSTSYNKLSLWITLGNSNFKSTLNNKKFSLLSLYLFQPLLLTIHLKVPFNYLFYHTWSICVEPFTFLFVPLSRCLSKNWCYLKGPYNSTSAQWVSVLEFPPSSSWIPEIHFAPYSKTLLFKERHSIRCHILHGHECKCSIISHTYCLGILQSVIDVRLFINFFFFFLATLVIHYVCFLGGWHWLPYWVLWKWYWKSGSCFLPIIQEMGPTRLSQS